jgi:anti-sigma regulatory factor (Ser/Thr protein kinase)
MLIHTERAPSPPALERSQARPCNTHDHAATGRHYQHSRRLIRLDPTDAHMSIATAMQPESARTGRQHADESERTAGLDLPTAPESARAARRFAHAALTEWRLTALVDDVDLVISELITNALLHARADRRAAEGATIRLDLEYDGDGLYCRVTDNSALPPTPEDAGDTAESGRGLLLVQALSAAWGWKPEGPGKVVWARFDVA